MKKIYSMIAALMCLITFSACNESKDDHPVLEPLPGVVQAPFLNIPEMTNASIVFTQDNSGGYVHMTCSQPDYGFAASVSYGVEVSFSEDFTTPVIEGEGIPVSIVLNTTFYDCSQINPLNKELASAVYTLNGSPAAENLPTAPRKLYMRLQANIQQTGGDYYPNTNYVSNIVTIASVSCGYIASSIPDEATGIYMRGGMNNWLNDGLTADWEFVTTSEFDVYILRNVTIPADVEFKIADGSWGDINLGTSAGDGSPEVGKTFKLTNAGSSGNIKLSEDFTGDIVLTKKGDNYTMKLQLPE